MRALVEIVGDAVAVGIERAAIGAHCDALRRTGATIEVVRDTIAVGVVGRATVGIDLGALRRGRALVEVIRHTVTVGIPRSEEHTSEPQSLMRFSYAVFCLKKKKTQKQSDRHHSLHANNYTVLCMTT